jgi:hypothetical protein
LPDRIAIGRILAEAHRVGGREPAGHITDAEWREECPLLPTSQFNPVWSLGLQAQFPPSWTRDYAWIEPHGEVLHFEKADGRWRYCGGEQGWIGEYRGHWRKLPRFCWSSNSWW